MSSIKISSITCCNRDLIVHFDVSSDVRKYFCDDEMRLRYPMALDDVPQGVLLVPFVANLLPVVWLADIELFVDELDGDFVDCIDDVRDGYMQMYPGVKFGGRVVVGRKGYHNICKGNACAMFYSGGLDSVDTFIRHIDDKPDLISIWGSDIPYENMRGWKLAHRLVASTAERFHLLELSVRSSFRKVLDEALLSEEFEPILGDGWWHGMQHALGLLGHVAPLAYCRGYKSMYIASSFNSLEFKCASSPLTDNRVRYCGCQVFHDGFDFDRMGKTENIVKYCNLTGIKMPLHVCWESQSGDNCCVCEKCMRTIFMILVQGGNPAEYGFADFGVKFRFRQAVAVLKHWLYVNRKRGNTRRTWSCIRSAICKMPRESIPGGEVGKFIRWLCANDLSDKAFEIIPLKKRICHSICVMVKDGVEKVLSLFGIYWELL